MTARVYAGLSAEQRDQRRQAQLLGAGLAVFADRGWAGSTVQDVCRTAGLSPRYFYELFDSREALFLDVLGGIAADVSAVVERALSERAAHPAQRLHAVLDGLARYFTDDARVIRVALMESLATPRFREERRAMLAGFTVSAARLMRGLRTAAPRSGSGAERSLQLSATLVTGGMVEALIAWDSDTQPLSTELLVGHLAALWSAAAQL